MAASPSCRARLAPRPCGVSLELGRGEAFWARLREHYADSEIVDLTLSIGSWIAMGLFTHVLGLDDHCTLPSPAADGEGDRAWRFRH
jgi:hypothetical protein